jgi:FMN phosphatase YigB (HAD superfamily)
MQFIKDSGNWADLNRFIEQEEIKHFSFDFWKTIAYSNPQFKRERIKYLSEYFSLTDKEEQINLAFTIIGDEYNFIQENKSAIISPEDLYLKVFNQLGFNEEVDVKKIQKDIEILFLKYPPNICQGFINFLELFDDKNITISITSNTAFVSGIVIQNFLESCNLLVKFKFCLFSDIENCAKPDKSIFDKVYKNTKAIQPDINLSEIIHIGDNINSDYNGAKNNDFKAFYLTSNDLYSYPRYALHCIKNKNKLPFSAIDYSRFKFGDYLVAEIFAKQLFEFFKSKHLDEILKFSDSIIIYSSPYSQIPTSSYYLTVEFYNFFKSYLNSISMNNIKLQFGKINRSHSYTEDYGAMSAKQRYDLIKNDTYSFFDEPDENSFCIFIDDISITGSHQKVIENLLKNGKYNNKSIFLYYAKLDNAQVEASFENELNFAFVNSIEKFLKVIISDSFKNTTRTTKFILSMSETDLINLVESILKHEKYEIISDIYDAALMNKYDKIEMYKSNLVILYSVVKKIII